MGAMEAAIATSRRLARAEARSQKNDDDKESLSASEVEKEKENKIENKKDNEEEDDDEVEIVLPDTDQLNDAMDAILASCKNGTFVSEYASQRFAKHAKDYRLRLAADHGKAYGKLKASLTKPLRQRVTKMFAMQDKYLPVKQPSSPVKQPPAKRSASQAKLSSSAIPLKQQRVSDKPTVKITDLKSIVNNGVPQSHSGS